MASNTTIKMTKLQSSDGEVLEVPETVARQSEMIIACRNIKVRPFVPVPIATAEVLKKVITYCEKHAVAEAADATNTDNEKDQKGSSSTTPASDEKLDNWDKQFIDVDAKMLYDLHLTATYLKLDGLRDLACWKAIDMMRCMNMEEIRARISSLFE